MRFLCKREKRGKKGVKVLTKGIGVCYYGYVRALRERLFYGENSKSFGQAFSKACGGQEARPPEKLIKIKGHGVVTVTFFCNLKLYSWIVIL